MDIEFPRDKSPLRFRRSVSGFLIDTNSTFGNDQPRPAPQVEQWLADVDDDQLFMSVISLAEILRGIWHPGVMKQKTRLSAVLLTQGTLLRADLNPM